MSEESLPLRQWPAGIRQASVPANENALRVQALLSRALSVENDAPGTEYNGAVYIVGSAPTGAFSTFSEHDIALFEFGSWYAWAPPLDTSMVINDVRKVFDGTEWVDDPSIGSGWGDTDDVPEGATNLYFTASRVRGTLLTGLSLASSAVIAAADSVLSAFGKLQAQITALGASLSGYVDTTTNQTVGGVKTFTGNPRVSNTVPQFYFEESDTAKIWVYLVNNSNFSLHEDSTSGANARLRILAGAGRLNLEPAGVIDYGGNTIWHAGNMPLASGTYTPTATGVANVSSNTPQVHAWMRVGNSVTMSGRVDVIPSLASTFTQIRIALPVPSNFASGMDVSGALTWNVSTTGLGAGFVNADATNDQIILNFICGSVANHGLRYSVTYPVLP